MNININININYGTVKAEQKISHSKEINAHSAVKAEHMNSHLKENNVYGTVKAEQKISHVKEINAHGTVILHLKEMNAYGTVHAEHKISHLKETNAAGTVEAEQKIAGCTPDLNKEVLLRELWANASDAPNKIRYLDFVEIKAQPHSYIKILPSYEKDLMKRVKATITRVCGPWLGA